MTFETTIADIDAEHGDPNRHLFNHSGAYVRRDDRARLEELGLEENSPCSICGWAFNEHGGQTVAELAQEAAAGEGPRPLRDCVCGHEATDHEPDEGGSWPCGVEFCACRHLEELDPEIAPPSAPAAEEPPAGEGAQMGLPGIEIPRLWPDFEGHRITAIGLGISGSVALRAGDKFHEELAERLRHLGGALTLTLETRIESAGHAVIRDKKSGAAIGRTGLSKIAIRRLVDENEIYDDLHKLELIQDDVIARLDELLEDWLPPEEGDLEEKGVDVLRADLLDACANFERHLRELRAVALYGRSALERPAEIADTIGALVSCGLCEHPKQDHDGLAGQCCAIFSAETAEGEPVSDICKCEGFRLEEEPAEGLAGALAEASPAACGKIHRGHLEPCPFPAAECELPEAEAMPE